VRRSDDDGAAPIRNGDWALFLDVDGTLLEIARRPDIVHVSERLRFALQAAAARECGALALVSGRTVADIDQLFAPHRLAVAGVHGAERRDAQGRLWRRDVPRHMLDEARILLAKFTSASPGLLIEDKGEALAIHYRQAMHLESQIAATVRAVAAPLQPHFHAQPGKCVIEIRPADCSKGTALEAFMREEPFVGRRPVFVGDDATDEDGFAAVNARGGLSIQVGYSVPTAARWRFKDVNEVIRWLNSPGQLHGRRVSTDGGEPAEVDSAAT
jgi:trehalose 6-phosphate phosphatase